jgi:FkbM family methyltransferase
MNKATTYPRQIVPKFFKTWVQKLREFHPNQKLKISWSIFSNLTPESQRAFLEKVDTTKILAHVAPEMLTPIGRFYRDGHNSLLYKNFFDKQKPVLVLGGYLGDSVQSFLSESPSRKILVMEPVKDFSNLMSERFANARNITILPYGAAGANGKRVLSISGEKSSEFSLLPLSEAVDVIDISQVISEHGPFHVMEVNIEGSEYEVLHRLIETGQIEEIDVLLLQFHKIDASSATDKDEISKILSGTHSIQFEYEWIWERWDRKNIANLSTESTDEHF